ncbi:MAG: diguanylate cyclase [Gammaproteobacteria bacterium]|nr:diguanylate cyclase [Gammaproteobacteria bacterium]
MDLSLFQRLTASELDQYLSEIDLALEYHNRWLAAFNRALVCHDQEDIEHFSQDLLHQCYFGRWYKSMDQVVIKEESAFQNIGEVHEQLHVHARKLIDAVKHHYSISKEQYDQFTEINKSFRQAVNELKASIKHDLKLIATLMGKIFENAEEGVIITDKEANILNVNPAFCHVTGFEYDEVIGKNPRILHSGRQDEDFYKKLWHELTHNNRWEGEIWNRRKDGKIYPEWLSITAVMDDSGEVTHYVAIFSDITSQKDSEERLYYLAHYDNLSKLPNRLAFHDRLKHAISQARRSHHQVAVLFLDLDGFKEVNDSMGHNAGDQVIREVASRLSAAMRESDTIARFGGDEFTILISEIDERKGIETAAQKIIDAVAMPIHIENQDARVTTSIGISLYPQDGDDIETLIRQADMAMYEAKGAGKNKFIFFSQEGA